MLCCGARAAFLRHTCEGNTNTSVQDLLPYVGVHSGEACNLGFTAFAKGKVNKNPGWSSATQVVGTLDVREKHHRCEHVPLLIFGFMKLNMISAMIF